jgi:hypothetical protein
MNYKCGLLEKPIECKIDIGDYIIFGFVMGCVFTFFVCYIGFKGV